MSEVVITKRHVTQHVMPKRDYDRPYVACLWLTPEGVASTDGYRMLVVPYERGEANGVAGRAIPADEVAVLATRLRNGYGQIEFYPQEDGSVKVFQPLAGDIDVRWSDSDAAQRYAAGGYRDLLPKGEPAYEITFSAELLADLLAKMARHGADNIRLKFYGPSMPTVIEASNRACWAVIMPVFERR